MCPLHSSAPCILNCRIQEPTPHFLFLRAYREKTSEGWSFSVYSRVKLSKTFYPGSS